MEKIAVAIPSENISSSALIGICVGGTVFLAVMVLMIYIYYRRRHQGSPLSSVIRKTLHEKSTTTGSLMTSPSGAKTIHLVSKKSPSPTQSSKDFGQEKRLGVTPKSGGSPTDVSEAKTAKYKIENEKETKGMMTSIDEVNDKEEDSKAVDTESTLGELNFTVKYNFEKSAFVVTIIGATNVPAKDPKIGHSDPYIKLQLLPDKQHKVKTRVLRKTLNPVYNEEFTFYGINFNQLQGVTLQFIILSFDRYSRDDIIGEVQFPLQDIDLKEKEITVFRQVTPRNAKIRSQNRGELLVSLCHQPGANRLTVVILKARNLPKIDMSGLCDPYVKIYLQYNGQRIAKKKTHVKKRTLNPVFNESFLFEVPTESLQNVGLEVVVLDWDRVTKSEVIGRLEIGSKSSGNALRHWNEVCNSPRRQIAEWHRLKE